MPKELVAPAAGDPAPPRCPGDPAPPRCASAPPRNQRFLRWALLAIVIDVGVLFVIRAPAWIEYAWRGLLLTGTLFALIRLGKIPHQVFGLGRAAPGTGRWIFKVCAVVLLAYLVLGVAVIVGVRATGVQLDLNRSRDFYDLRQMFAWLPHAILLAPILEELLYRAVAVPALGAWVGPRWAIFLSGPLFYLLHVAYLRGRWIGFHYLVAGWILAWAFTRRRSIWVPMVLHALGNLLMGLDDVLLITAGDFIRGLLAG